MTFSYSLSLDDNPPKKPLMPLWAYGGVDALPAPEGNVLVRRKDDDRRALLRVEVAAALDACRGFATLGEHAEAIGRVIPELAGKPDEVLPVLQQMIDLGLMQSAEGLHQKLQQSAVSPGNEGQLEVFIITCDRPTALARLLDGLATQTDAQRFRITVVDDSREAASLAANSEHCQQHSAALNLRYFGADERARLIDALQQAVPAAAESVSFLLDRDRWPGQATYGLARNIALLLSAGRRALILDDDVLPIAIAAPDASDALRFGTANERRLSFGEDVNGLLESSRRHTASPLALSAEVLGKPLATSIAQYPGDFHGLKGARADHWLELDGSAPIVMTQCGTYGDPGTGDKAHWLVNLPADDIKRLLAAGPSLGTTLGSRAMWMGYRQPTAMRFGAMSALTGLDNRDLLPPYLPVQRGEDLLFGIMLEKLEPRGVVLGQHWALPHLPIEDRGEPGFDGGLASRISVHALAHWLDKCDVQASGTRADTLAQIAGHIERLTNQPVEQQRSLLKAELTRQHLQQFGQVGRCLRETGHIEHAEWQQYLGQVREELLSVLQQPLSDQQIFGDRDPRLSEDTLRREGGHFAAALKDWPALWHAARDLVD